jgi:hypothetical protein
VTREYFNQPEPYRFVLVAQKSDLGMSSSVREKAQRFAEAERMQFVEVSAKTNSNLEIENYCGMIAYLTRRNY